MLVHGIGPVLRARRSALRLAFSLFLFAWPWTGHAVTPVDPATIGLQIKYRVLSQISLEHGESGLELELTLNNTGEHGLYDLRIFLQRVDSQWLTADQPALVRMLEAGERTVLGWTFEGLHRPYQPDGRPLEFRIEAVDTDSQGIVTFMLHGEEVR